MLGCWLAWSNTFLQNSYNCVIVIMCLLKLACRVTHCTLPSMYPILESILSREASLKSLIVSPVMLHILLWLLNRFHRYSIDTLNSWPRFSADLLSLVNLVLVNSPICPFLIFILDRFSIWAHFSHWKSLSSWRSSIGSLYNSVPQSHFTL